MTLTTKQRQVIEMAVEQISSVTCDPEGTVVIDGTQGDRDEIQSAITALRALLDEPQEVVEPVAVTDWTQPNGIRWMLPDSPGIPNGLSLYTAPPTPSVPVEEVREMISRLRAFRGDFLGDGITSIKRSKLADMLCKLAGIGES